MPAKPDVFDYVIVGAGAAGCVLANRLAASGSHTVCLLEAGPPDNSMLLRIPAGVYKASSSPKYAWLFETEPARERPTGLCRCRRARRWEGRPLSTA